MTSKMKKQNFLSWNYSILKSSLKKINLNIIPIVILDFFFYILSGYFIFFWMARISDKISSFSLPADITAIGIERAQQLSRETQSFYYLIVFSFVLLLIFIIFLASILKGIIWVKITKVKITLGLISKFLALNLAWLGFWFVLIFLISWIVEIRYAFAFMAVSAFMGIYLSNNLYPLFISNPGVNSVKSSLKLSIAKIHLFLLPYLIIFTGFFLVFFISGIARIEYFSAALTQQIYGFLGFNLAQVLESSPEFAIGLLVGILANPLLLIFAAFTRYYISTLAAEISKSK